MMNYGFGQDQVFIISRSGSGHVLVFNISFGILSKKPELEIWKPICGLKEFCCVSYKCYVFIIGGYNIKLKRCVDHVKRYDVTTKMWTDLPSLTIERRMCTAAVFNNEIIICGGFRSNNKLLVTTEILNIKRKKWRKGPQMKRAKADQQLLVLDNSVISVGGVQQVCHKGESVFCGSDEIYEYQDVSSGWQTLDEDIPLILGKPVYLHATVVVDSKIFIIGGLKTVIDNKEELSEVINDKVESLDLGYNLKTSYDISSMKDLMSPWDRSLPSPYIPRYGAVAIAMGQDIYLIGGTAENYLRGICLVERFHSKTMSWSNEFEIKQDADLSMVCGVKVFGSKYKMKSLFEMSTNSLISLSVTLEIEEEEKDINEQKMYRVGWVLW